MNRKLVYVDTDVGLGTPGAEIDDGAALIFLLHNPLLHLIGAGSVFGNVPIQDADLNLDRLLTWLGREDMPRGFGAAGPLLEYCLVRTLAVEVWKDSVLELPPCL